MRSLFKALRGYLHDAQRDGVIWQGVAHAAGEVLNLMATCRPILHSQLVTLPDSAQVPKGAGLTAADKTLG